MNKTIAYIRTSTGAQTLGLKVQREAMKHYEIDAYYVEQVSGRKENRQELKRALEVLVEGDTLMVYKLDRLGRSTRQLVNIMAELDERGINLRIIKEQIDTSTSMGRLIFTIMASIAQLEAEFISERTKESLKQLRDKGVKLGNKGLSEETEKKIIKLYEDESLTIKEIAEQCDVCSKTVYNVAKRHSLERKVLRGKRRKK